MADTVLDQQAPAAWQPAPALVPGPEMSAARRFHVDCVWTGKVHAGGMGPGSPEMEGKGKATFRPLMDGLWLAGDFEQEQFVDGKLVITWRAHYVVGWSPPAQEYRVTYVDNNGSATLMRGRIEGDSFIVTTLGDDPVKIRLTWAQTAPGAREMTWRNECSINGSSWFLIEEYICEPV